MEVRKVFRAGNSIVARPIDVEGRIDPVLAARVEGFIDWYERALKELAR